MNRISMPSSWSRKSNPVSSILKEYLFNKKWRIVQQELPFEEDTANADVQPDAIPEAGTDFNQEVAEFQQAMNDAGVDIIMNGKKIKSRKPRKVKQLAS